MNNFNIYNQKQKQQQKEQNKQTNKQTNKQKQKQTKQKQTKQKQTKQTKQTQTNKQTFLYAHRPKDTAMVVDSVKVWQNKAQKNEEEKRKVKKILF